MDFEVKIIEYLQAGASDFWTFFFKAISILGSYVGIVALLVAAFFICRKRFVLIGGALGGGLIVNIVLKHIIQRDRPYVAYEQIAQLGTGSGYSFPSSHAVCATILAVFLCYLVFYKAKKKSTKVLTVIVSVISVMLVCLSRMFLGLHYFTDVCGGIVVGVIVSVVMILCYKWFLEKWLSKIKFLNNKKEKDE